MSKNKKGETSLMILAGSKKAKDKTQLFVHPKGERLGFDQNDTHPKKVFVKVEATFKSSKTIIQSNKED